MSGAGNNFDNLGSGPGSADLQSEKYPSSPDVQIVTPLDVYFSSRRSSRACYDFAGLSVQCRKYLYDRAVAFVLNDRGGTLTYMNVADQVAQIFNIAIAKTDR